MGPDDADHQLGARLDSALRASLDEHQVDVDGLLAGSRRRAGQLRKQRIAMVTAVAVLVIAVPVGLEVFRPSGGQAPEAVMIASDPPPRSPAPGPNRAGTASPTEAVIDPVSEAVLFPKAELPPSVKLVESWPASDPVSWPIVPGRTCPHGPAEYVPRAAGSWTWAGADPSAGVRIRLTVTRWAPGTGSQSFDDLVQGTGACRWQQPQTTQKFTGRLEPQLADETWASSSDQDGAGYGRAVVRTGDWITGVEVRDPAGSAAAVTLAQQLVGPEVARVNAEAKG